MIYDIYGKTCTIIKYVGDTSGKMSSEYDSSISEQ